MAAETLKDLSIETKHPIERVNKKIAEVYSEANSNLSALKTDITKFDETVTFDQVINVLKDAYGKLKGSNFKDVYQNMGAGLVVSLQIALKKLDSASFPTYGLDGMYGKQGSETWNMVKKFQEANGLVSDGWAGQKTIEKLLSKFGVNNAADISSQTVTNVASTVSAKKVVEENKEVKKEENKEVKKDIIPNLDSDETDIKIEENKDVKKEEVKKEEEKKEEKKYRIVSLDALAKDRPALHFALTKLGVTNDAQLTEVFKKVPEYTNEKQTQDKLVAFLDANMEKVRGKGYPTLIIELGNEWSTPLPVPNDADLKQKIEDKEAAETAKTEADGTQESPIQVDI